MTRDEAIKILKEYSQYAYGIHHNEQKDEEAFDMAISALSADGDLISRADAIEAVQDVDTREKVSVSEAVKAINALPSAELTLRTPQTHGKSINPSNAEVVADLISRTDAIEAVNGACNKAYCIDRYAEWECPFFYDGCTLVKALSALPSAEATGALDDAIAKYVADGYMLPPSADRPMGEWKPIELNGYPYVTCDQCGMLADMVSKDGEFVMSMANAGEAYANFCPNCGADMRGNRR